MKKIYSFLAIATTLFMCSACNNEWEDELYTQMVSLKAPYENQGVTNIYLRYKPNGEVTYKLPVIVSGSKVNEQNLDVHLGVDNDTLKILNEERYQFRTDLHYQQLSEQHYEFTSPTCHIPAGSSMEMYEIKFKFKDLNLIEKWVLPMKVEENPSYIVNRRKGNGKALLRVMPFNDYSGTYSATSMRIYLDLTGYDKPLIMNTRTAWVVDENSVFFYAGVTDEEDINRATYKIIATFKENGKLDVRPADPANPINFALIDNNPTYEIRTEADPTLPYLTHYYVTMYIKYSYDDITSMKGTPIRYNVEGSMTTERKINELIPDEDQAIEW